MKSIREILRGESSLITITTVYPSDEEKHICPYCQNVVPKKRITLFNREYTVQPVCDCEAEARDREWEEAQERFRKREIERRFSISDEGERFSQYRFDTFIPVQGTEAALRMAREFAETFGERKDGLGLLIWGQPGNGKSHLAAAICHQLKEAGHTVIFKKVPNLLERIRNTFRRGANETEQQIMDALRECDLLVMDDIGAEKVTDWVLEVLFRIIDGRYSYRRPIVFTTNFSPTSLLLRFQPEGKATEEQEIAAKRIHDRIIGMTAIVENRAPSYRRKEAETRAKKDRRGWSE